MHLILFFLETMIGRGCDTVVQIVQFPPPREFPAVRRGLTMIVLPRFCGLGSRLILRCWDRDLVAAFECDPFFGMA